MWDIRKCLLVCALCALVFALALLLEGCGFTPAGGGGDDQPPGKPPAAAVGFLGNQEIGLPLPPRPVLSVSLTAAELAAPQEVRNLRVGEPVVLGYEVVSAISSTTCERATAINGVAQVSGDWVAQDLPPTTGQTEVVLPFGETIYGLVCEDEDMSDAKALVAYAMRFDVLVNIAGVPTPATWNTGGWYSVAAGDRIYLDWESLAAACDSSGDGDWPAIDRPGTGRSSIFLAGNGNPGTYTYTIACGPYRASVVVKVGGG